MRRLLPVLLLSPALMAGKCVPKHPTDDTSAEGPGDVTPPEVKIQVISIDPSQVEPNTPAQAVIFGAGFDDGAKVFVGDSRVSRVVYGGENTLDVSVPPLPIGTYDVKVVNPDGKSGTLRGGLEVASGQSVSVECQSFRVGFALDSANLSAEASSLLKSRAHCFENFQGTVRVEGHCDERGTTEYNLALGARRAEAVQRFIVAQGVPPSRVRTLSFGEERPLASGHDEGSWTQNRRAEVLLQY